MEKIERKEFLKRLGLGSLLLPLLSACTDENDPTATDPDTTGMSSGTCTATSSETAGPFPTKNPASLVLADITSDRTGVGLAIKITVQNKSDNCEPLEGVMVDIWHCDKDGYYSEYGGTGLQSVNLTAVHFLRGRQATDMNGQVGFASVFPGWYASRAPHIHVHIYDATGKSLLVTQIAFPTAVCDTVYTTATQFYTKGKQDISNATDNVFADSLANEMSVVTGNITDGYILTQTIVVSK